MTQKIILIRHAKSSWDSPTLRDHDRPLNKRGRDNAPRIGKWLRDQGHLPDLVLVSTSARTVETSELIRSAWDHQPKVQFLKQLYHADPQTILSTLQAARADTIALIGHNPGIAYAAETLALAPPDHPRFFDYPTCATTVLKFDREIQAQVGICIDFTIPADLKKGASD